MKRLLSVIAVLAACAIVTLSAPQASDHQSSAEAWLSLVDKQQYAESWTEAASLFRSKVPQEKWVEMVKSVREPLGPMTSRSLSNVTTAKSLPGVPDGEYAIVQFRSAFKNKAEATETVTLAREEGKMKAVGYFIR